MLLSPTKNSYSLPLKALPSPLLLPVLMSVLTGFRWKHSFQSTICRLLEWQTSFTVILTAPEQIAQSLLSLYLLWPNWSQFFKHLLVFVWPQSLAKADVIMNIHSFFNGNSHKRKLSVFKAVAFICPFFLKLF